MVRLKKLKLDIITFLLYFILLLKFINNFKDAEIK